MTQPIWRFGPCIGRPPSLPSHLPCCQFYLDGNLGWKFDPLPRWQVPVGQRFFIHLPVNMNFAAARDPSWSLASMVKQVEGQPAACVLHIGNNGSINTIANRLNKLKLPQSTLPCSLLLEPPAGEGNKIGGTWAELRLLFEALDKTNNIGLCLDTQHLFGAGMCQFYSSDEVERLFDYSGGLAKIGLIHLNDSLVPFNSKVDRHQAVGQGHIWADCQKDTVDGQRQQDSLARLLELAHQLDVDVVSETHDYHHDYQVCSHVLTAKAAKK